jgi:DNA invertase Pin-like site-specific DNA recombinase
VIIERTVAGMAAAKRRGRHVGRPRKRVDIDEARALRAELGSIRVVAERLGVSVGKVHATLVQKGSSAEAPAEAKITDDGGA